MRSYFVRIAHILLPLSNPKILLRCKRLLAMSDLVFENLSFRDFEKYKNIY